MKDLSEFQRGQIVGARLAGSSVTKTSELLHVSRGTVSKVMSAYQSHGQTSSSRSNCGRKRKIRDYDHTFLKLIVSRNEINTAPKLTAELNKHLINTVSIKTVRRELREAGYSGKGAFTESIESTNRERISASNVTEGTDDTSTTDYQ